MQSTDAETMKAAAADRALQLVRPGMIVGLGSGTTARYFTEGLGRLVSQGLRVEVVATSDQTRQLAQSVGLPFVGQLTRKIDLAVDGADEIDPERRLIKGRGGALVREKLVAASSERFIVIADDSKLVSSLGRGPLPVEILPFLWPQTVGRLRGMDASAQVRGGEQTPLFSDNGNMIVDMQFQNLIGDPAKLARDLKQTLGVVDHGLFETPATACIIAGQRDVRIMGSLS